MASHDGGDDYEKEATCEKKRRKTTTGCGEYSPFDEGSILVVDGRSYIDYDKLSSKLERMAVCMNIMPIWFLKMVSLVDKVDALPACTVDKKGRVTPSNYPKQWLMSEIADEKVEYNSLAQLLHPEGRYMRRFRDLVWTRTNSGMYQSTVTFDRVEGCMKGFLLDMGWKEEWIDKCLRAKSTDHFDFEYVEYNRPRDHCHP